MDAPRHPSKIQTRILIISDTHGKKPLEDNSQYDPHGVPVQAYRFPLPEADVAIHCGDLTYSSRTAEFEETFSMLRRLSAPLKLVIPGNHDLALDRQHWAGLVELKAGMPGLPAAQTTEYHRRPADVQAIVDAAAEDGVHLLAEGTHEFALANGAKLRVFASPMTPEYGSWAFQYPEAAHHFDIPDGVDVAVTHGPPKDVLDTAVNGGEAGCPRLFDAVYRARPKIHCFGHIHEGWGAKLVTWKTAGRRTGYHCAADVIKADETRSMDRYDDESEDRLQILRMYHDKCRPVDLSTSSDLAFKPGEHTLFVNAAIMDARYRPLQVPWLVKVELPRA